MPQPVMPWFSGVGGSVWTEGYISRYGTPAGLWRARLSGSELRLIISCSASAIASSNFFLRATAFGSCRYGNITLSWLCMDFIDPETYRVSGKERDRNGLVEGPSRALPLASKHPHYAHKHAVPHQTKQELTIR